MVLVSVIIPTLRVDKMLLDAIDSVAEASKSPSGVQVDYEVVVVIDGPLGPGLIELPPHTRVMATGVRMGSAAASNVGIRAAHGEFYCRLDADDLMLPSKLVKQVEYMRANREIVGLGCRGTLIDAAGNHLGRFRTPVSDRSVAHLLLRTNPFIHSSLMIRMADLEGVCGYDESCTRMQDYELILRLARVGKVDILDEILVAYRVHSGQTSSNMSGFVALMWKISRRRRELASSLNEPIFSQLIADTAYSVAQLLRYAGLRRPRYLKGSNSEI